MLFFEQPHEEYIPVIPISFFLCWTSVSLADKQHETLHRQVLWSLYEKEVIPFALITIPKSGTHMLMNIFYQMGNAVPHWQPGLKENFDDYYLSLWKDKNHYTYLCTHFCVSPTFEKLCSNVNLKKIVCIRDLRDVCVSMVHHAKKHGWPGLNTYYQQAWNAFKQLSFDEQLLFVINYEYNPPDIKEEWQFSLPLVAEQAIRYCNQPNVLVCFYENLVGKEGGGTKEAQLATLASINQFLNFSLSEDRLLEISSQIYGIQQVSSGKQAAFSKTFRKAKIGSWKEVFKEEHKEAFKKKLGWALIYFGYEKNNNW
ncbi:MAG: sulfotransferase domain-containing protein [Verrucomicrobia bacterium]|nr:sulfotransferase domain-containing protein [Verrucomicrobiota bacterium]